SRARRGGTAQRNRPSTRPSRRNERGTTICRCRGARPSLPSAEPGAGGAAVEITSLGHAGLQVAGAHSAGLVDPWFDPSGAYLGSWHQFPDNRHLLTRALLRPDWVVVTDDGGDRCDPATLARIPPGTP